jgi:hypothetical protein
MTESDEETRYVAARHFLICRSVWNDPEDPDTGISLGRIVFRLRPPNGEEYPFVLPRFFAFFHLIGDAGEYQVLIEQIRIGRDDVGDEIEHQPIRFASRPVLVTGDPLGDGFVYQLTDVEFESPGVYEFRLRLCLPDDIVTLAEERIELKEQT